MLLLRALLLLSLGAAAPAHAAPGITVAVAANMSVAFKELAAAFTTAKGIAVTPIVGPAGKLTGQIRGGTPVDVFLSSDTEYPASLHNAKLAEKPQLYARGLLVLWTTKAIDVKPGLSVLALPAVKKIGLPSPDSTPYGQQAVAALAKEQLKDKVQAKLVVADNMPAVNTLIETGAVDAGFTAKSVVVTAAARGRGQWVDVALTSYTPVEQMAVVLKKAPNKAAAKQFFAFLFTEPARRILKKNGFQVP